MVEQFIDKIKDFNGVLQITIPYKLAKYGGFKAGDIIKVSITKVNEDDELDMEL